MGAKLDYVSFGVDMAMNVMDICGFDLGEALGFGAPKPPFKEILAKLDQTLAGIDRIEGEIAEIQGTLAQTMTLIMNVGENIENAVENVGGQVTANWVADLRGDMMTALDLITIYNTTATEAEKPSLLNEARTKAQEAINAAGQIQADDAGLAVGAIMGVTVGYIMLVEQMADGAFASAPYKDKLTAAADNLRAGVDVLEAKATSEWAFHWDEWNFNILIRLGDGVDRYIDSVDFSAEVYGPPGTPYNPNVLSIRQTIMQQFNSGGMDAVVTFLRGVVEGTILVNQSNYEDAWDDCKYLFENITGEFHYGDQIEFQRPYFEYDQAQSMRFDDMRLLADSWDVLASGAHLQGGQTGDVLTATEADGRAVIDGFTTNDAPDGNDRLTGNSFVNAIRGGTGNDVLIGLGGDDTLRGGSGNDVLNGGAGGDVIDGGDGIDTASYADAAAGATVSLLLNTQQDTLGAGKDTITRIENVDGSAFADAITGTDGINVLRGAAGNDALTANGGNDTLQGGLGRDTLRGGLGVDTASYEEKLSGVKVTLNGNFFVNQFIKTTTGVFVAEDTLAGIENVTGGAGHDEITGDGLRNTLVGGGGNDILKGGGGNDTLYGDSALTTSTDGTDTLDGGLGDDRFERVSAGKGVDQLTGGEGRDTYVLRFGSGNVADVVKDFAAGAGGDFISFAQFTAGDRLDGFESGRFRLLQVGADTHVQLETGPGTTVAYETMLVLAGVNAGALSASNFVDAAGAPTASFAQKGWNLLGTDAGESITGTAFGELINGYSGNDTIRAGAGHDSLFGWFGDDVLEGGAGNDAITGGSGVDTATYFNATAGVTVSLALTAQQNTVGAGRDTLATIENLNGSNFADRLTGSTGANAINGYGGNDRIQGGNGADVLTGGTGADTFVFAFITDSDGLERDRITDLGATDRIDLSGIDANGTGALNTAFTRLAGDGAFTAAGQMRLTPHGADTWLELNVDTDADAETVILLNGNHTATGIEAGWLL